MPAVLASVFIRAAVASASARARNGPTRTRKRVATGPCVSTNAAKPFLRNIAATPSAAGRVANAPACTSQVPADAGAWVCGVAGAGLAAAEGAGGSADHGRCHRRRRGRGDRGRFGGCRRRRLGGRCGRRRLALEALVIRQLARLGRGRRLITDRNRRIGGRARCGRRVLAERAAHAAPNRHAQEEDGDGQHDRRHEEEEQLLPAQLNLTKWLVRHQRFIDVSTGQPPIRRSRSRASADAGASASARSASRLAPSRSPVSKSAEAKASRAVDVSRHQMATLNSSTASLRRPPR